MLDRRLAVRPCPEYSAPCERLKFGRAAIDCKRCCIRSRAYSAAPGGGAVTGEGTSVAG